MLFNQSNPVIDKEEFERKDWTSREFGHAQEEELPRNILEPRGFGFTMIEKFDADHAADTVTCILRTVYIVYLNSAPIYWN